MQKPIIVYVEKYLPDEKEVLFDFYDSNGFLLFINTPFSYEILGPSFVEVINYSGKRVSEGSYYRLNADFFKRDVGFSLTSLTDSPIVGFRLVIVTSSKDESQIELFLGLYQPKPIDLLPFFPRLRVPLEPIFPLEIDEIELVVKRVGQGNWNEAIFREEPILVFDFGCSYHYNRVEMLSLVGQREIDYSKSKPVLIISHWDIDHYCLLRVTKDISCFSYVFVRTPPPNLTSRIIFSALESALGDRFVPLVHEDHPEVRPTFMGSFSHPSSPVKIFNASRGRSRNTSGIACIIETREGIGIFSADHHYDQIKKYMIPKKGKPKEIFIVPHHGGNAGKVIPPNSGKQIKIGVVSVGKNRYGHPKDEVINTLTRHNYAVYVTSHHHKDFKQNL